MQTPPASPSTAALTSDASGLALSAVRYVVSDQSQKGLLPLRVEEDSLIRAILGHVKKRELVI